jgi:membrane-anchored glycerophosphoryl diester phosphodiesterase (GDPDase)
MSFLAHPLVYFVLYVLLMIPTYYPISEACLPPRRLKQIVCF